ncbi:hypothetical protein F5887DRAFT_956637 [Amanita rubescens]|nr:hypothetical protein F5887DRAFT_956637 [Amanita rubescens]
MLDVTKECAMYIVEYCKTQNFIVRAIQNVISTDMVLDSFEKAFADLRMEFLTNGVAQAAIGTIRIMESVEDIASDVRDINAAVNLPMHETSWDPQSVCLPGSQKQILNDIARWAIRRDPEAPIFLLVGPPGCGKTRIANSTAFVYDGGHLGASVFLDRGITEHRNPTKVFSSIARELAAFDNQLKLRISKAISLKPCLGIAVPERQFQGLIIEPLSDLTIIGPILVIIDGLDVWQDRNRVLSALINASNLHPNLRFLITSRPEADIVNGLKGIPHCHQRRMTADEEGLVEDVTSYSRQCLEILQDNRPSIFADYSVEEVLDDFEAKSLGIYLWLSVAIRFLTVVSNDTARAFLSIICSVEAPPDYAIAMSILKCSIHDSLKATSQVKLKSEISVGAAMALGVTGLWSDKAPQILNVMLEKQLLQHDDNASRFLSSMLHPWSTEGMTSNRQCSHPVVESGSVASNVCMAHVCVTFLCDRLSSDICSDIYVTKNDGEDVIDARLWKRPPHHLRPYVAEAYGYATKFWIEHLKDVQDDCCIPFLEQKLRNLIEHIFHLHEYMGKDGRQTAEVLRKFLDIFEASVLLCDPTIVSQAKSLLNKFKISPHGCDRTRVRPRRKRSVRRSLSQNSCFCPLYRTWKITSPNTCTLKACLKYAGKPTPLSQCLMVTPAIVPMIDEGGHICRTIGKVALTVDRTASDDEQYPCASDNMRIGVAIIQKPCDEWAGKLPSPVPQDSPIDMMGEPWLWPLPGDKASAVIDWEGLEEYLYPLQAGDQLAIVAEFGNLPTELPLTARFLVTLDIEYELEHRNDEK